MDADSPGLEYFASTAVPLEEEQFLPKTPVGVNPQETLTEKHKHCHLHDAIRWEVVELQPVGVQQSPDKKVKGEGEASGHVVDEHDPFLVPGARNDLAPRDVYLVGAHRREHPVITQGLQVPRATTDFVQSPTRFFAEVEAEEALVAKALFVFPIATGKHRSGLEEGEMAQDEMRREAGARKKKGMQRGKCGNSVVRG